MRETKTGSSSDGGEFGDIQKIGTFVVNIVGSKVIHIVRACGEESLGTRRGARMFMKLTICNTSTL